MRLRFVVVCLIVAHLVAGARVRDFPSYMKIRKCRLSDPAINDCLLEATRTIKPYLIKGIPELKINPIDPLIVNEITIEQDSPNLNYSVTTANVTIRGLRSYNFQNFEYNISAMEWIGKATVDQIDIDGDISIIGRLKCVSLSAKGKFIMNLTNSEFVGYHRAKKITKGSKIYLSPEETVTDVEPKNITVKFMFEGLDSLNRAVNDVLAEESDIYYKELKPKVQKVVSKVLEQGFYGPLERRIPFSSLYISN